MFATCLFHCVYFLSAVLQPFGDEQKMFIEAYCTELTALSRVIAMMFHRYYAAMRPPLVAGAAANRLQDVVLVYPCLHGLAPAYLSVDLQSIKDLPSRQRLRLWSSDTLAVPTSNLSTVGNRTFPDCRRLSLHESGTLCRRTFVHPALCQLSSVGSRPSSSHEASLTDATA